MDNIGKYVQEIYLNFMMSEEEKIQAEYLYESAKKEIENEFVFNTEGVSDEDIDRFSKFILKIDCFNFFPIAIGVVVSPMFLGRPSIRGDLLLIFRYNSCNLLAKVIMNVMHTVPDVEFSPQQKNKSRRYEAKKFIQECTESQQALERKYKLIFWSLMILVVDQNNIEEHLSLICAFVQLLHFTEEEFEDILCLVRHLYHNKGEKYTFKTKSIANVLGKMLESRFLGE